ncbi:MAG: hypothetical protein ISS46_02455 [Candidatus Omnitrophica bacterium]|nr:hypothetical protein [Candidatus Omnitrophota bacterium]
MKKIFIVIVVVLALLAAFVLARNMIAKIVVSVGVKSITGLGLNINTMNVGIPNTVIDIEGMKLLNPPDFKDTIMADMPEIYVNYDLRAFLKKNVHLKELKIDLKEFVVVKNEGGKLNLDSLKAVQAKAEEKASQEKKEKAQHPGFKIDVLQLKIGKVIFKDYSQGSPPKITTFDVDINEQYENITDPEALAKLIVVKALINTTIAKLTNFNLVSLTKDVSDILNGAVLKSKKAVQKALDIGKDIGKKTKDTVEGTVKDAAGLIKKVLPLKSPP